MMTAHRLRRLALVLVEFAVALAIPLGGQLLADEPERLPPPQGDVQPAGEVRVLTLAESIAIGLQQQPAVVASRASLAASESQRQALDKLAFTAIISREVPIRRQQSSLGVTIAAARVVQAEHEAAYAIKRTYFSLLYARQQQKVAQGVVREFQDTLENAKRLLLGGGARNVTQNDVDKATAYVRLAEMRVEEANRGVQQAQAALREALGLGPHCAFDVADQDLPELKVALCKEDIINLALSRRAEITQAESALELTKLEIEAQDRMLGINGRTFASASDIHANPIPQGTRNGEYRPGGIGIEMPTTLVGCRADRVKRARALSLRAAAVVDKTRNLIALEAADAFAKWEEASNKVPKAREAEGLLTKLRADLSKDFKGGQNIQPRDLLEAVVLAAQARAQYNEALFQQANALATLERVTAGGFCAGFEK